MPANIPIKPFYSPSSALNEYRADKCHYFAVAMLESLDRGAIVGACVNTGRNAPLSDSVLFGVRPDNDNNVVVDARGIWTVEAWLEDAGADRLAPMTPQAIARAMNDEPGMTGKPDTDAYGFDDAQREEIEVAKATIDRDGLAQATADLLQPETPTPA